MNTNPCLDESNDLLKHLVPRMMDNMLSIILDPIFPFKKEKEYEDLKSVKSLDSEDK